MPEKEWPTRTVGPSCRASTRSAEATASGSVVKGFCTDVTFSPDACKRGITSDQLEPSANSPCTSTTLRAFGGAAFAAMPRVETSEAAAPASRAVEKLRLFIIVMSLPFLRNSYESGGGTPRPQAAWASARPLPICRQPAVSAALAQHVPETREGQMVATDQRPVGHCALEESHARLGPHGRVQVEPERPFRMLEAHL